MPFGVESMSKDMLYMLFEVCGKVSDRSQTEHGGSVHNVEIGHDDMKIFLKKYKDKCVNGIQCGCRILKERG